MNNQNQYQQHSESFDMKSEENAESRNQINAKLAEHTKTETNEAASSENESVKTSGKATEGKTKMSKGKKKSARKNSKSKSSSSYKGKTLYGNMSDKDLDKFLKEGTAIYKKSVG